jgi:NADH:ubiquinone oxidoreductase subunit 4 (subunit M)
VSPAWWFLLTVSLPWAGAAFALALPAADRLTLRTAGVVAGVLAFAAGVALTLAGGAVVVVPGTRIELLWGGPAVPAALTLLATTPLALRAGAPRIETGLPAYVVAVLVGEGVSLLAVLATDVRVAIAAATVAAVPVFALVALFGGPLRGSVTYRAAGLWVLVDVAALAALALLPAWRGPLLVGAALGPGLVRLAAGPWGLWALPVFEQAPVAAACLIAQAVAPTGAVLLWRVAGVPGVAVDALGGPLVLVLAVAAGVGAALVVTERDLRRLVAHMLGVLGALAAAGLLSGGAPAERAVPLVVVTGFAAAAVLIVVEALERRLETRRLPELAGVLGGAPLLGALLPACLAALTAWPGPGTGVVAWDLVAGLAAAPVAAVGAAGAVFGVALLVASVVVVIVVVRVALPQRRRGQDVRVSFLQGVRLLLPLLALGAASVWAAASPGSP